jgi:nucleoside-diphosphate-sugar epimerase
VLDITRAREHLGWQPAVGFEDGLRSTLAWMQQNPHAPTQI